MLAGCSVLPTGDDEFSCPAATLGGVCASARAVYAETHVRDELTRQPPAAGASVPVDAPTAVGDAVPVGVPAAVGDAADAWQDRNLKPPVTAAAPVALPVAAPAVAPPPVTPTRRAPAAVSPTPAAPTALPVLSPARIMRIWIGPWVDAEGNLHAPGYVFTPIEERQWAIGLPGTATALPQPRQIEPRAAPSREPRPVAGAGLPAIGLPGR